MPSVISAGPIRTAGKPFGQLPAGRKRCSRSHTSFDTPASSARLRRVFRDTSSVLGSHVPNLVPIARSRPCTVETGRSDVPFSIFDSCGAVIPSKAARPRWLRSDLPGSALGVRAQSGVIDRRLGVESSCAKRGSVETLILHPADIPRVPSFRTRCQEHEPAVLAGTPHQTRDR